MPEPLRLKGIAASSGYAEGPLFPIDIAYAEYRAHGEPGVEAAALKAALERAAMRIGNLIGDASDESAAMLEFQLAMLEDEALTGPAFVAIAEGKPANDAWVEAIDAEIVGYEVADDEYFRARAADMKDIRAQVLRALTDAGDDRSPPGAILFGEDIAPTRFLETDWSGGGGIALTGGSTASHVAMLARSRGIPMVVGLGRAVSVKGLALLDVRRGLRQWADLPDSRSKRRQIVLQVEAQPAFDVCHRVGQHTQQVAGTSCDERGLRPPLTHQHLSFGL